MLLLQGLHHGLAEAVWEPGFWVTTISLFLEAQLLNLSYATDTLIFKLIFNF